MRLTPLLVLASLGLPGTAAAQWVNQRPPANLFSLTDVHFTDADHGYASASIGGLMKTADGGQTWLDVPTGVQSSLRDVFFVHPDTGFVVGNVGVILRTVDGGRSWQRRDLSNAGSSVNGIFARSGRRAWVTQNDQILATTDGGQSWNVAYTYNGPLTIFAFRFLEFPTAQTGYAVGGRSGSSGSVAQVIKTTDGGQTWTLLPSLAGAVPMKAASAVAFPDAQNGYVADVDGRLFRTQDGGVSWSIVAQGSFGPFYGMYFTSPLVGYGVGFDGNLRRTQDGGVSWTNLTQATLPVYASVYFPTPQVGYTVGDDGTAHAAVLKYTAAATATPAPALPGVQVYPNPSTGLVRLSGLPATESGQASISSLTGQVLRRAAWPAAATADISTAGLAAGCYLLRVSCGGRQFQQKLLVR